MGLLTRWIALQIALATALVAGTSFADLPLSFEANVGQADPEVKFVARSARTSVFLTSDGALIRRGASVVRMRLIGAAPAARPRGLRRQTGQAHYFIGKPRNWRTGVPLFGAVEYVGVYPGVDLVFYGKSGELEYDFRVAPGADPRIVRIAFEGMDKLERDGGDLVLHTAAGRLRQRKPRIYQNIGERQAEIEGGYELIKGGREVRLALAPFDRSRALIVDPVLSYATFAGGAGDDRAWAIAVDSAGCAYITGETWPADPSAARLGSGAAGSQDVFVTKLNASGTGVVYSVYLGGRSRDTAKGIAVDASGSAYVTGFTYSADFPTTTGAYQTSPKGMEEAFVFKLAPNGASLVYSTLLGGAGSDLASAIAVDASGNAYIAGYTSSLAFPVSASAAQRTAGGGYDAFAAKLNASGSGIVWSTYIGGRGLDLGYGIAVDALGSAYVVGTTTSANFPVRNAYQNTLSGPQDAFVVKLSPAGDAFSYATYLGGTNVDSGAAIAVDGTGAAYVAGSTYSANFPVTATALQRIKQADYDAFVTKLNPSGTALSFSTFLGGSGADTATAIAIDNAGRAVVTGYTSSANFPTQQAAQSALAGRTDLFVAALNETGTALMQSTYIGGANDDQATGVAVDSAGAAYVTGLTLSTDFPATAGAWHSAPIGGTDAFVAKIPVSAPNLPPSMISATPSSGSGVAQTFTFVASDPNGGADIEALMVIINSTVNSAGGCVPYYDTATNTVKLASDSGAWLPSVALGSTATLENSQCRLEASGSSAAISGSTLAVSFRLTFKSSFIGSRQISAIARDRAQTVSGWQQLGTWTVTGTNQPPSIASVAPSSGSGFNQTFTFVASDPDGGEDIEAVMVIINNTLSQAAGCVPYYDIATHSVKLAADSGAWLAPVPLGSAATLQNSQCILDASASSAVVSNNAVILNLKLTFKFAFSGPRQITAIARDRAQTFSGWQQIGTWTVPGVNQAPAMVSVTPSSGRGTAQTFSFLASDANGSSDIEAVMVVINSTLGTAGGCVPYYDTITNTLTLSADNGAAWLPAVRLGAAEILQNSQCSLDASASSVTVSDNTLVLNLALKFKAGFAGVRQIYAIARDRSQTLSNWQGLGSWTVTGW